VAGRPRGHDRQGQRQAATPIDDVVQGRRLGGHAVVAQAANQQVPRLIGRKDVEPNGPRSVPGDQSGEVVATGHDNHAARGAWQQWADLVGVASVVQHHERPPAGQQGAIQPDLCVELRRHAFGRDAERVQEDLDRPVGAHHRARTEPAQVDVELAVWKRAPHAVSPVDGQGGLSHAGRPGDRRDDHSGRLRGRRRIAKQVEVTHVVFAAGEADDVRRKLCRHGPIRRRPFGRRYGFILRPGGVVEPIALDAGQAERVGEDPHRG
jgi:hypothetical protein